VRRFSGGDAATAAEWMILFASAWGLAQFLTAPVLGALSDRFGRRPVLLLSTFGLGVDFVVMAFAPSLPILLAARLISGATSATFPTAHAYVADVTPKEERAAAFGKLASAISLGFIAGPALGGWLAEFDLRLPFLFAAAVTLVNALYGLFVLPESLRPESRSGSLQLRPLFTFGGFRLLRGDVGRLAGVSFLNRMGDMIWGSVWVLYCAHRFGWSPSAMGLQILAAGLLGVTVQAWGVGRVVRALGERRTLLLGAAVSAALAWAAVAPNGWWYVAGMPLAAFGLLLGPGLQGLLSNSVGPDIQGRLQGTVQGLNGLATIVGPPIYGGVFAWSLRQSSGVDLSGLTLLQVRPGPRS
jgi:DHA1 family tetracycline resistance protein-like MFS transporter